MIDAKQVIEIAEKQLQGSDLFVVECKTSPMGEIDVIKLVTDSENGYLTWAE